MTLELPIPTNQGSEEHYRNYLQATQALYDVRLVSQTGAAELAGFLRRVH